MECNIHFRSYQYVCKAAGCDLSLLCSECRKSHIASSKSDRNIHAAQIISIKNAIQQGDQNLKQNIRNLKDIISPFQNQQAIFQKIQGQKRRLLEQRDNIIRQINQVFDGEIAEMEYRNKYTLAQSKQSIPFEEIKTRIAKLEAAQKTFKSNSYELKQALVHSENDFIHDLRKNKILSSMNIETNQYYAYDDNFKHDFFLSRLELKKKTLNNKLLQKVHNQSDLYFLIDDYQQGKCLHYFSAGEMLLRIFDLETLAWKQIKYDGKRQMPSYGATVYEKRDDRFYLIGGQIQGKKSQSIIWYSSKEKTWNEGQLRIPRSSAMATLLYSKSGQPFILIAGGVSPGRNHLKDCELYSPNTNTSIPIPPMNFAVTSGCLVTYNNSIVFRIGGLGEFKAGTASICEIAEKCDLTQLLQKLSSSNLPTHNEYPKWTYLDLEAVNNDIIKKFNLFYANQAGIQINPNQILIFGGITHNNSGVTETYIIEIQSLMTPNNRKSTRYYARWINQKPLISAQGFSGLRPIIYDRKVMSLQNISCGQNELYQKEKRLIEFNMYQWKEIENIVNI